MGSHGHDDEGPGRFLTSYCKTNSGDDGAEGRRLGMAVGLSGSGAGGNRSMDYEGVRA